MSDRDNLRATIREEQERARHFEAERNRLTAEARVMHGLANAAWDRHDAARSALRVLEAAPGNARPGGGDVEAEAP